MVVQGFIQGAAWGLLLLLVWWVIRWARRKVAGFAPADRAEFDEFMKIMKKVLTAITVVFVASGLLITALGLWYS